MLISRLRSFSGGGLIVALLATLLLLGGQPTPVSAQGAPPEDRDRTKDGLRETTVRSGGRDVRTTVVDAAPAPDGKPMRAGSLVIRFRSNTGEDEKREAHQRADVDDVQPTRRRDTVRVQVDPAKVANALDTYRRLSNVVAADPDYVVRKADTPNDALLSDQWALDKVGAATAWNVTHSFAAIKIAILDCGIYGNHPDLQGKLGIQANFTSSHTVNDLCDHGTHVAGSAGARTNNGEGVAGLGWNATLMNGKVLDDEGVGTLTWIINGIDWAADNGAKVISMSLEADQNFCPGTLQDAVNAAHNAGTVIVAAGGNNSRNWAGWPANCNHVVGVAATDPADQLAHWSSTSFSNYGTGVDVGAPGKSILSSVNSTLPVNEPDLYQFWGGTSMATPHVAGLAALLWATEEYHDASPDTIVNRIISTGVPFSFNGWSSKRIDAAAALNGTTQMSPPDAPPAVYPLTAQKSGNGTGTVSSPGLNCGAPCGSTFSAYEDGADVTLQATAASGSTFGGWSGCDSSNGSSCTVNVDSARTVTATFTKPQPRTLTVNKSGSGKGSVSGSNISCGQTCTSKSASYTQGTTVVLTATAASGSTFGSWSGCNSTNGNKCTVVMDANKTVTATFTKPQTLTVKKSGNGKGTISGPNISCGTSCTSKTAKYAGGQVVTLNATPNSSSTFVSWTGCDSTSGTSCTVTMSGNRTVTANFAKVAAAGAPCDKPKVTFTAQQTEPLTYLFTATPTIDPPCTLDTIEWKTNKGQESNDNPATIVFPKKGTYKITVTVTDSAGNTRKATKTMGIK